MAPDPTTAPLDDHDIEALQSALDAVPPPLEPLDVSALDGYLCGVLLQPQAVAEARWWPRVVDADGRAPAADHDLEPLRRLVRRRHAELARAIERRDWFDPWVFALDESATVAEAVLPWVAGFASAMDAHPALMAIDDPELVEPLALMYLHFDPDDLEDADALKAVIETLEPPQDLGEAVQDLVRATMLMADVSRPRRTPAGRAPPGRAPRSRNVRRARRAPSGTAR